VTDDVASLAHRTLITYSRALTEWGSQGGVSESDGTLLFAGGSWLPVGVNGAFCTDDMCSGDALITAADTFFGERKRGYSVKVRDTGEDTDVEEACRGHGLVAFGDPEPEMLCRHRLNESEPPAGVVLRRAVDEQGVRDFVSINTDAYAIYGMPTDVLGDLFDRPDQVLAHETTSIVVAYLDERPVATALTFVSDGSASLQWVGTVTDARNMRLGQLVTEWATNVAFDMGAASCTLQASTMGAPLYAKLGYETIFHYQEYVRWSATPPEVKPFT